MNELRDVFTKYKAVVFFDTETTGLEAESCQIIELAAIRVEKTERGTLRMADSADVFVKLPEGERIPQKIVELTGITDEQLKNEGITEAEAAARFTELISGGRVLLVAHNAQFDLLFTAEMLRRHGNGGPEALKAADYLDSLTVYKDRRAYPHKLANAILAYKLEDKVQNSHRAIDDVAALFEVCKAMDAERSDLLSYPEIVAQIEASARTEAQNASGEAVAAERQRIEQIDSIAASIPDQQLVHDAKYGDNPCTAQELCFRVMQASAASGQNFLAAYQAEGAKSGAADVGAAPNGGTPASAQEQDAADIQAVVSAYNQTKGGMK